MADEVQRRMEQIAPSIGVMKDSGLFNEREINLIVSRLKSNECRLTTGIKSLEHFKAAISFEINLLCEMKKRRAARTTIKSFTHLDFVLLKRVRVHYLTGLRYFPTDFAFNLQYLHFLSNFKEQFKSFIHMHIQSLLARFSHVPAMYNAIARWYEDNDQPKEANLVLLTGQSRHPESGAIYIDLIRLAMKMGPENEKKIFKYLDIMVEKKLPSESMQEAYLMCQDRPMWAKVADYAVEQMKSHYRSDASMWAFLTLRPLVAGEGGNSSNVEKALEEFKEALRELSAQKQTQLWILFVDQILKRLSGPDESLVGERILEAALSANVSLTEVQLEKWVLICEEGEGGLLKAELFRRVEKESHSENLWHLYMAHLIRQDAEFKEIEQTFHRALSCVGPNCIKLFEVYLRSAELYDEFTTAKKRELFEKALKHSNKVALHMKPRYLLFVLATEGVEVARNLYSRIAATSPYSEELHEEMLNVEKKQQPGGELKRRAKTILDGWLQQFAATSCKAYLRKVEVIRLLGEPDMNEQIRGVYESAMKNLGTQQLGELKDLLK